MTVYKQKYLFIQNFHSKKTSSKTRTRLGRIYQSGKSWPEKIWTDTLAFVTHQGQVDQAKDDRVTDLEAKVHEGTATPATLVSASRRAGESKRDTITRVANAGALEGNPKDYDLAEKDGATKIVGRDLGQPSNIVEQVGHFAENTRKGAISNIQKGLKQLEQLQGGGNRAQARENSQESESQKAIAHHQDAIKREYQDIAQHQEAIVEEKVKQVTAKTPSNDNNRSGGSPFASMTDRMTASASMSDGITEGILYKKSDVHEGVPTKGITYHYGSKSKAGLSPFASGIIVIGLVGFVGVIVIPRIVTNLRLSNATKILLKFKEKELTYSQASFLLQKELNYSTEDCQNFLSND